jgi:hypothetical protein
MEHDCVKAMCILIEEFPNLISEYRKLLEKHLKLSDPPCNFMQWEQYFKDAESKARSYTDDFGNGNCERKIDKDNCEDIFGNLQFHFKHIIAADGRGGFSVESLSESPAAAYLQR